MKAVDEPVLPDKNKINEEIIERRCSNAQVLNYVLLLQNIKDQNEKRKRILQAQERSKRLRKRNSYGDLKGCLKKRSDKLLPIAEEKIEA